jgi:UTP-glucose-1-phosphate uridylyltransferase
MKTFQVAVVESQLKVELFGVLDTPVVTALLAEARALLTSGISHVLVNTNAVTDCTEAAKKELVTLQRELSAKGRRSAWLDERARFRGIALWVMHLADDPQGKAVSTLDQALRWLSSTEAREANGRKAVGL